MDIHNSHGESIDKGLAHDPHESGEHNQAGIRLRQVIRNSLVEIVP